VPPCVWSECDFHVNWLHVSRIRPTHWRLNDDFDINQLRRRLTQNIHIGVLGCICICFLSFSHCIKLCQLPRIISTSTAKQMLSSEELKSQDFVNYLLYH